MATNVQILGPSVRLPTFPLPWKSREALEPEIIPETLLPEFTRQFDDLVDLLCWSAKEGDHEGRDEQYASLRAWFLKNYETVRPFVLRHMTVEPEDVVPAQPGQPAPRDAVESLFLPRSVDVSINSDTVIFRIIRARAAVNALIDDTAARLHY